MNKNKKSFSFTIKMTENKQYNVIGEILFDLFLHQFKQKREQQYIINKIIVNNCKCSITKDNKMLLKRMKISSDEISI